MKWIDWEYTDEKPYPETLETLIFARFADGYEETPRRNSPITVDFWYDENPSNNNFHPETPCGSQIVAYAVVS